MSSYVVYLQVGVIAVMGLIFHLMPRLARREIYFAVTVPGSFPDSDRARRILGGYRLHLWMHTAVGLALVFAVSQPGLAVTWQVIGFLAAFLIARHRVLPHGVSPDTTRDVELAPREIHWPGRWIGQLGPFVVLALVGAVLLIQWESLPEQLPVHWGADGQPDRFIEKTMPALLGRLAQNAMVCALMAGIGYGILGHSRRIQPLGPGGQAEATFQRRVLWILLGMEYYFALTVGAVWLVPLVTREGSPIHPFLPMAAVPLLLLGVVLIFVRVGQGGNRLSPGAGSSQRPIGDRTPDQCWKLGLIYVNRGDAALFVEKRFGIGYTLNFGHYVVWILLAAIVGLPMLIRWLSSVGA